MSEEFHAFLAAENRRLCETAWLNLMLIADHDFNPVDRPVLAREALAAIERALTDVRFLREHDLIAAAADFHGALFGALMATECLLRGRPDCSSAELIEQFEALDRVVTIAELISGRNLGPFGDAESACRQVNYIRDLARDMQSDLRLRLNHPAPLHARTVNKYCTALGLLDPRFSNVRDALRDLTTVD